MSTTTKRAKPKLTGPQLSMLVNIWRGRSPTYGLYGRSAYGGAAGTLNSLITRGLVDASNQITIEGATVVAAFHKEGKSMP